MSGLKKIRENRQEGANYDILEPEEGVSELFVDGSINTGLAAGVAKVDFYVITGSVEENGAQIEQRRLKHRLVMPTVAWIELCASSMAIMRSQKDEVLQVIDEGRERIARILDESQQETDRNE